MIDLNKGQSRKLYTVHGLHHNKEGKQHVAKILIKNIIRYVNYSNNSSNLVHIIKVTENDTAGVLIPDRVPNQEGISTISLNLETAGTESSSTTTAGGENHDDTEEFENSIDSVNSSTGTIIEVEEEDFQDQQEANCLL